ncbi:hypothetical protein Hanom_Chr03g00227171 [Helianthus anomalus]
MNSSYYIYNNIYIYFFFLRWISLVSNGTGIANTGTLRFGIISAFYIIIIFRVNYKFCPLCLHQIAGAVLFSKSLQAVSLTFQNLARYVLLSKPS